MAKKKAEESTTPAETKVMVEKIMQNGVTRPKAGTSTGLVWEIADEESTKIGAPIGRAKVLERATALGLNPSTVATQYAKWCKFHGISKSTAKAEAEAEVEAEVEEGIAA